MEIIFMYHSLNHAIYIRTPSSIPQKVQGLLANAAAEHSLSGTLRKDVVLIWHNRITCFLLGSIWDLIWVHTCHLALHVTSIYPGVARVWHIMRHTHWLIPYFQVWHTPHLLAHPSLEGCGATTPISLYLFTGCVTATLRFARKHPTTLVPFTA